MITGAVVISDTRMYFDQIVAVVLLVNSLLMYLVVSSRPENIISTGIHETIGPCNLTQELITPLGQVR